MSLRALSTVQIAHPNEPTWGLEEAGYSPTSAQKREEAQPRSANGRVFARQPVETLSEQLDKLRL